ncbi:MAG: hypothetical protein LBP51_04440 [Deferribacteraceae bacterium]|nr:hypothetical protein [Deferribacteraceae bacterium]
MEKISNYIIIVLFLLILAAPTLITVLKVKTRALYGAVVNEDRPIYTKRDIFNGKFQHDYELWYNQNFYSRTHIVRLFTQLRYTLFHKVVGTRVVIGAKNTLFETGYLRYADIQYTEEQLNLIKAVKNKCEQLGKRFFFIIPANKVLIYPERTPMRYVRLVEKILENSFHIRLAEKLETEGIPYFNSTPFLFFEKSNYNLFAITGVHWNLLAAALVLREISRQNPTLFKGNITIEYIVSSSKPFGSDADLFGITNLKYLPKTTYYAPVLKRYSGEEKEKIFLNGTSFDGQLVQVLSDTGLFAEIDEVEYTYVHRHYEEGKSISTNTDYNISYYELLNDKDIVIISSGPTGAILLPSLKRIERALDLMLSGHGTDRVQNKLGPEDADISIKPLKEQINAKGGEKLKITVKFTNNSNSIQASYNPYPVKVITYWTRADRELINNIREQHNIKGLILPKETVDVEINVRAPDAPGEYLLQISAAQELVMQYESYNKKLPVSVLVRVR